MITLICFRVYLKVNVYKNQRVLAVGVSEKAGGFMQDYMVINNKYYCSFEKLDALSESITTEENSRITDIDKEKYPLMHSMPQKSNDYER